MNTESMTLSNLLFVASNPQTTSRSTEPARSKSILSDDSAPLDKTNSWDTETNEVELPENVVCEDYGCGSERPDFETTLQQQTEKSEKAKPTEKDSFDNKEGETQIDTNQSKEQVAQEDNSTEKKVAESKDTKQENTNPLQAVLNHTKTKADVINTSVLELTSDKDVNIVSGEMGSTDEKLTEQLLQNLNQNTNQVTAAKTSVKTFLENAINNTTAQQSKTVTPLQTQTESKPTQNQEQLISENTQTKEQTAEIQNTNVEVKPQTVQTAVANTEKQTEQTKQTQENIKEVLDKAGENKSNDTTSKPDTNTENESQMNFSAFTAEGQASKLAENVAKMTKPQQLNTQDVESVSVKTSDQSSIIENAKNKTTTTQSTETPTKTFKSALEQQVQEAIRTSVQQGRKEITVQLNPPQLGKITIKFKETADGITGIVEADKSETKASIEQGLSGVIRDLQNNGIDIKKIDVQLNQESLNRNASREQLFNENNPANQEHTQNAHHSSSYGNDVYSFNADMFAESANTQGVYASADEGLNLLV